MLRRSFFLYKANRSWTKASISASAHFPDAVKADPAAQRTSATSAKETRSWTLADKLPGTDPSATVPMKMPNHVEKLVKFSRLYCNLVRFDRPVGWLLLMIPCYWGSALAVTKAMVWEGADPVVLGAPFIPLHLMVFFAAGAYLMRSAGCIVNDMWDREFDRKVERTASRPLASGDMTMTTASAVLVSHVALAGVIAFSLSPAALAACVAITPIWIIYPFMKRVTYAPQLFLGLCFNWGIFVGYAAVLGRVDLAVCVPMYCAAVLWTILYDTIYAYQDRRDDLKCGVKSTAIWIGDRKYILQAMVAPVVLGMMSSGLLVSQSLPFYLGMAASSYYLYSIVDDVNIYDGWSCARGFKRNVSFGWCVFLSLCVGNFFWACASEYEQKDDVDGNSVKAESSLAKYVFFNQSPSPRLYTTDDFNWVDRALHPVFVMNEEAKTRGESEPPLVPAWMRREYLGDNIGTLLWWLGVPLETVEAWQQHWYSLLDHYNMFGKIQL